MRPVQVGDRLLVISGELNGWGVVEGDVVIVRSLQNSVVNSNYELNYPPFIVTTSTGTYSSGGFRLDSNDNCHTFINLYKGSNIKVAKLLYSKR